MSFTIDGADRLHGQAGKIGHGVALLRALDAGRAIPLQVAGVYLADAELGIGWAVADH